jgi:alpha-tubulin suppressor-like RCC1 family protein
MLDKGAYKVIAALIIAGGAVMVFNWSDRGPTGAAIGTGNSGGGGSSGDQSEQQEPAQVGNLEKVSADWPGLLVHRGLEGSFPFLSSPPAPPPDGDGDDDDDCTAVMSGADYFAILTNNHIVSGPPENYQVLLLDDEDQPNDWIPEQIKSYVIDEECISEDAIDELTHYVLLDRVSQFGVYAAGHQHNCRMLQKGYLSCWGDNSSGQTAAPSGLFKTVSAGAAHSCAIRATGEAVCWGAQTTAPSGYYASLSSDDNNNCVLDYNGTATCWGAGLPAAPQMAFTQIDAGPNHACAVTASGSVSCWGDNSKGQASAPGGSFTQVAVGLGFSCGLDDGGAISCWGDSTMKPTLIGENEGHRSLFAAGTAACAVKSYMDVQCWGTAAFIGRHPSEEFSGELMLGKSHACGMMYHTGGVVCWGDNSHGQTAAPEDYTHFVIGENHVCGLSRERIYCRGHDDRGQLIHPSPISGRGADFVVLQSADNHLCGMRNHEWRAYQLSCWGDNTHAQLDFPELPPQDPDGPCGGDCAGDYTYQLATGSRHGCATRVEVGTDAAGKQDDYQGVATCWGDDADGQASPPIGVRFARLAAGDAHTCGIDESESIQCWGNSDKGQTAAPSGSYREIAAHGNTSCAIDTENNIACWGDDSHGQASPPDRTVSEHVDHPVSVSETQSCAISENARAIFCWGGNGETEFGSKVGFRHVAVRGDVICAAEENGDGYCWGDHPASDVPLKPIVDAGSHSATINKGIVAFRFPDAKGDTCSACHAPDGIDLAYVNFDKTTFLRRAHRHLSEEKSLAVWKMLKAHRARYNYTPSGDAKDFRPLQPGGDLLAGDTPLLRDFAFAKNLKELKLAIADSSIASKADAITARDELLALDIRTLPAGLPFMHYSEDGFHGAEHARIDEWIPAVGHVPAKGKKHALRSAQDNYIAEPSDLNFIALLSAVGNDSAPAVSFNHHNTRGQFKQLELQRYMAMLILSHEMRRDLMGKPPRAAGTPSPYPVNAFWNLGAQAKTSGQLCMDTDTDEDPDCVDIPHPFNTRLPEDHDRGADLMAMSLPMRWAGTMFDPGMLKISAADTKAFAQDLENKEYFAHRAFMLTYHRIHKYFGADQTWRNGPNDSGDLATLEPAGLTEDVSPEHEALYDVIFGNCSKMLLLLKDEATPAP